MSKAPLYQQQQDQVDTSTSSASNERAINAPHRFISVRSERGGHGRGHSCGRGCGRGGRANNNVQGFANRNNHTQAYGFRRAFEYDSSTSTLQKRLHLPRESKKYKHQQQLPYAASLAEDVFNNSAIHSNF